jgi:hypothetical protein
MMDEVKTKSLRSKDCAMFGPEIGLDRIHSQGDVHVKLTKQEDRRASQQFTPMFFSSHDASETRRVSEVRRNTPVHDRIIS